MYLHGNNIADMLEIPKLAALPSLKSLTLHVSCLFYSKISPCHCQLFGLNSSQGNPIEQEEVYRICVLFYLPFLKHLDFIGVTKGDRANATQFGGNYESHWHRRHSELEHTAKILKESQEMSLTQRIMQAKDDDDV
jgi:hypothetical protein